MLPSISLNESDVKYDTSTLSHFETVRSNKLCFFLFANLDFVSGFVLWHRIEFRHFGCLHDAENLEHSC